MILNQALTEEFVESGPPQLAELVQRAQTGDTAAFSYLYRNHVNQVFAFAARRLSDRDAAEEATQETFTRALEGLHRCRNRDAFSGWLFGIANHVVDRQLKTRQRLITSSAEFPDPMDRAPGPEDIAVTHDVVASLRTARSDCLSDADRTLFDLILAELTDKEIAIALGRRSGAVRTARWRLLSKLRACMTMRSQHPESSDAPV